MILFEGGFFFQSVLSCDCVPANCKFSFTEIPSVEYSFLTENAFMRFPLERVSFAILASLFTFTTSSFAQTQPQQVLDAATIANQALTASGQGQALLLGTVASGTTTENGIDGTVVIETKGTAVRYAFSLAGQQ